MNDLVVVDASLALKWVLNEPDSDRALALLNEWNSNGVVLLAPSLLAFEVTNALYKNYRRNKLTFDQVKRTYEEVLALGIVLEFSETPDLGKRAVELANQYTLSAAYDAHYLAMAEREGCELWTADMRFWNSIKNKTNRVRMIGDYMPLADTISE